MLNNVRKRGRLYDRRIILLARAGVQFYATKDVSVWPIPSLDLGPYVISILAVGPFILTPSAYAFHCAIRWSTAGRARSAGRKHSSGGPFRRWQPGVRSVESGFHDWRTAIATSPCSSGLGRKTDVPYSSWLRARVGRNAHANVLGTTAFQVHRFFRG